LIKDCQDIAVFTALYLFLIGMVAICVYFILFAAAVSPETQRWSQSLLAAILSGTVSFIVGRKVGK
jgi:replication initiation and membrane attachment protein DnaB